MSDWTVRYDVAAAPPRARTLAGADWTSPGVAGVAGVSSDDLETLNNAIITMTADVDVSSSEARQAHALNAVALTDFQGRWTDFIMRWNQFFADHQTFVARQFADPEFAAFREEYKQKRAEWLRLGAVTSAPDVGTSDFDPGSVASSKTVEKAWTGLQIAAGVAVAVGLVALLWKAGEA